MMANGGLVRVLIHTDVTKYLNFKAVDGGFVYNKKKVDIFVCTNRLNCYELTIQSRTSRTN